jgi:hypothetical protein
MCKQGMDRGVARLGGAWRGGARIMARRGVAGLGEAWPGGAGRGSWLGSAWHGEARIMGART